MYIEKITIEGVRGFSRGLTLDFARDRPDLAGWTVVAGRNGSGKTTLLRALASAALGRDNTVALMDNSYDGWLNAGANAARVELKLRCGPSDGFVGKGNTATRLTAALAWVRSSDGGASLVASDADAAAALRGPWAAKRRGWCLIGYGAMRRLSGHTADGQRWMSHGHPLAGVVTLFREDASLAEAVARLREEEGRAHLETVLALLNDGLLPDPSLRCEGVSSRGLLVTVRGRAEVLESLPEGYRVVGALVIDLLLQLARQSSGVLEVERRGAGSVRVLNQAVVLIDEVDAHLHVTWQRQIGRWLTEHFPGVQFIVTSHSPFVCQAADRGGLVLLPAPDSPDVARIADEALWRRVTGGSIDDALLSEVFGLDHTWSDRVAAARLRLAELEGSLLATPQNRAQQAEAEQLRAGLHLQGAGEVDQQMRALLTALQQKAS